MLTGKHALITGGAGGIGAEIAEELARNGAYVTLLGRDAQRLHNHARRLSRITPSHYVVADITDHLSVKSAFTLAREKFGPVAILINNAGQAESAPFLRTNLELWQRMLTANLTGTYSCCTEAVPDMMSRGWGRIVNIASTAGIAGYAYVSAYCSAKHGVIGLTRALAIELATFGITVNAVCPGYTDTDILQTAISNIVNKTGKSVAETKEALASQNPQGRFIKPREISNTVAWLCEEISESITGQSISVSGGEVMT